MKAERCRAETKGGKPCGATVVAPSGMCAWHAPEWAARRREWSRKGGENRSNRARAAKASQGMDLTDVRALLGLVLRGTVTNRFTPGQASACAAVARALVTIHQSVEVEERLGQLEAAVGLGEGRRRA